jgi:hypothetical protein
LPPGRDHGLSIAKEPKMIQSNGADPNTVQIPALYVDAVHLAVQPFTVQVVLGNADMNGQIKPCIHLTMSPEFAAHLAEMIQKSLAQRSAEGAAR